MGNGGCIAPQMFWKSWKQWRRAGQGSRQSVLSMRALEVSGPGKILGRYPACDSLGSLCLLVSLSFCFVVLISGWGGIPGGVHGAKGHCIVAVPPPGGLWW